MVSPLITPSVREAGARRQGSARAGRVQGGPRLQASAVASSSRRNRFTRRAINSPPS